MTNNNGEATMPRVQIVDRKCLIKEELTVGQIPVVSGEVWAIRPDWSEWVLDTYNTRNRNPTRSYVRKYTRDMENGEWKIGVDQINFSTPPVFLMDGQKRLMAVAASGKTIPMRVNVNLDPELMASMDVNEVRPVHQLLSLSGSEWRKEDATILKAMLDGFGYHPPLSYSETVGLLDNKYGESIRFARHLFPVKVKHITVAVVLATIARAHYNEEIPDDLARFASILANNYPSEENKRFKTVLSLSRYLLGATKPKARVTRMDMFTKTQRMLHGYLRGEVLLKCTGSTEHMFPIDEDKK